VLVVDAFDKWRAASWKNFGQRWVGAAIGALIAAAAIALRYLSKDSLWRSVSEALFIAGVLTLTVDSFVKWRLVKDASKDIFHHIVGFDLPGPIKDRLKQIIHTTTLYRKDMEMICTFSRINGGIQLDFEIKFEVVNPTRSSLPFRQYLAYEKSEKPKLESIALYQDTSYGEGPANFGPRENEEFLLEYEGKEVKIKPEKSGERYIFTSRHSLKYPGDSGFHVHTFSLSTIGFAFKLRSHPPDLMVTATAHPIEIDIETYPTKPANYASTELWYFEKLFMAFGDDVRIRWEPRADSKVEPNPA